MIRKLFNLFLSFVVLFVAGLVGFKLSELPELRIWRWYDVAPWQEVADPNLQLALQIEQDYPVFDVIYVGAVANYEVIIVSLEQDKNRELAQSPEMVNYFDQVFIDWNSGLPVEGLVFVMPYGDEYWVEIIFARYPGAPYWDSSLGLSTLASEWVELPGNPYN